MIIQCERIWIYEFSETSPYIFERVDGVDIKFNEGNDKIIELLDVDKPVFFIDNLLKGGLQRSIEYGGEDTAPYSANGKNTFSYSIEFNLPLSRDSIIEHIMGKEFSLLAMRRDLSYFAIFGRFVATQLDIDNEIQQRVTLECVAGNYPIFEVNNLNITGSITIIGIKPVLGFGNEFLDFWLN